MIVLDDDRATLHLGDSSQMMKLWPDKAFDSIITDPPYGIHTHRQLGKESRDDGYANRKALNFDHVDEHQIRNLAAEFVRLATGWIIIFTDDRSVTSWGEAVEAAGGRWVRTGHWVKNNPMPQMSGDRPAVGTEPIVICHATGKGRMRWNGGGRAAVWRGPVDRLDHVHPTQKPVWLMQRLVGAFTDPGGLILDPFVGSGSTLVGALVSDRRLVPGETRPECVCKPEVGWDLPEAVSGVGIDCDAEMLQHAARRIRSALRPPVSLEPDHPE